MKEKFIGIIKNKFIKNVIILATGTVSAQAIGMLFAPIITRLYGPEAYGLMGTFMAITSIIIPISALTYPIAIVLPKNNREASGIAKLSLIIILISTIITTILIIIFETTLLSLLNFEGISLYLYFIPLAILLGGFLEIIEQWLVRTKQFTVSSKATFSQAILSHGSKAGVGLVYPFSFSLIVITALNRGLKSLLIFIIKPKIIKNIFFEQKSASIKYVAKKYKDFPLLRSPEVLLFSVTQSLPLILLTSFFGPAAAGFYSIGHTLLQMPSVIIGRAVGDVFYPRISEAAYNKESLFLLIKKATIVLGLVGLLPFTLIIIFGPDLFELIFGDGWRRAGEYARWLALGLFFGFIKNPSIKALPVISAHGFNLVYSICIFIIRIGSFYIGYYLFSSDLIAIALFGVTGAILNLGQILITLMISKKFDKQSYSESGS